MNNKIKLIGLFNESAANEEMPKRIKFEGDIFELDEDNVYKSSENGNFLTDSINFNLSNLNDYVEILEEEIDIESIRELPENSNPSFYDENSIKVNRRKINEILRAVKQLDKKINKED